MKINLLGIFAVSFPMSFPVAALDVPSFENVGFTALAGIGRGRRHSDCPHYWTCIHHNNQAMFCDTMWHALQLQHWSILIPLCVSFRAVPKVTVISEALRKAASCDILWRFLKSAWSNAHLTVLPIVEAAPGTNRHQLAQAFGRCDVTVLDMDHLTWAHHKCTGNRKNVRDGHCFTVTVNRLQYFQ